MLMSLLPPLSAALETPKAPSQRYQMTLSQDVQQEIVDR